MHCLFTTPPQVNPQLVNYCINGLIKCLATEKDTRTVLGIMADLVWSLDYVPSGLVEAVGGGGDM